MVFHKRLRVMAPDLGHLIVLEMDGPTSSGNTTKGVSIKVEVMSSRGASSLAMGRGDSTREDRVPEWVPTAPVGAMEKAVSAPGHRICT